MPNHVHPILMPGTAEGIGEAVGETHRRYTNFFNARGRWSCDLLQSRFACAAMDEAHLMEAVRCVGLNPLRARLMTRAQDWPWSSVRAHIAGADDELAVVAPVLERVDSFAALMGDEGDDGFRALRWVEGTGCPIGTPKFVAGLERLLCPPIARRAPGRKKCDAHRTNRNWCNMYPVDMYPVGLFRRSTFFAADNRATLAAWQFPPSPQTRSVPVVVGLGLAIYM